MTRNKTELDQILNETTEAIKGEVIDQTVMTSAASRVWERLSSEASVAAPELEVSAPADHIHGCEDFQTLIPAYLRKELSSARSLLLEDHTQECIPCRKALKAARSGNVTAPSIKTVRAGSQQKASAAQMPVWKWAIAATLVVGFALSAMLLMNRFGYSNDARATIQSADGAVYLVTDTESRPLNTGEVVSRGDRIRTARDATATVRLSDGSLVEMRERSELSVSESSGGTTVNLARGNVIVQAAKQKDNKHLYVATNDALVSVVGTIFAVNNGTKGSRVSVVEGEVHVESNQAGTKQVLRPGDQTTTNANLELVPVKDEIAWSKDADRYARMVTELAALRKELNQKVPRPGVRTSTRFLKLMPEGTVLYAALPNLAATLSESHRIMQERIGQNAALREWLDKDQGSNKNGANMNQVMQRVREFGEYLGDEIVASAGMNDKGEPDSVLVLGELKNSAGFRPFLEKQIASLGETGKDKPKVRIIDDPATATASPQQGDGKNQPSEILVWIKEDFFAAAPKLEQLQQLQTRLQAPDANSFTGTPFYARINEIYSTGAGLIVAADLEKIVARIARENSKEADAQKRIELFRQMGLSNLKYFIVEQKEFQGKTQSQAMITFNESRQGIASWLAAPGPMGALEFISPDANVAAAFVVKEPVSLVNDLLGYVETASPGFGEHLKKLETEHGIDLRKDIAAPLGGEYAFAIDGPILPTPSWKMVLEVYDQAKLQQSLERMVEEVNKEAAKRGMSGLQWERTEVSGRTFYALKSALLPVEFHYTYANGYMVAAPSRALVDRALRFRESGYTLLRSQRFISGLPADGNANFSAIFYHDLAPLIEPLAKRVAESGSSNKLSDEQREALKSLGSSQPPTLAYAIAQGDRIVIAANTEGGPFGLSPASLFGMPNSFAIQHIIGEAMSGKKK